MSISRKIEETKEFNESGLEKIEDFYNIPLNSELEKVVKRELKDIRKNVSESLRSDNVCFLTGNGTSIYAGTKDTTEFDCKKYFNENDKYDKEIYDYVFNSSIEKVLNNLIILLNYYQLIRDSKFVGIINTKIKKIEDDFIKNNVCAVDYSSLLYHEILLRKLKNLNVLNKTHVFTLNYDLAFEYSCDKLNIDFNNGFSGFVNRIFDGKGLGNNLNLPSIVKLHGSLNWYVDDNNYDIKEAQPIFKNGRIMQSNDSYLIYPTSNKFMDSQNYPFSELLRNFLNTICNKKNVLFIIGYKYEDTHVNDILRKALYNPNIIIYAFNYKVENTFINEIKNLSTIDERINYFDEPFISDFRTIASYLIPTQDSKSDLEIVREILSGVER